MKDRYTIIDHMLKDLKEDLEFSSKDKGYIHIFNNLSNDLSDLKEKLLNDIRLDETIDDPTITIKVDDDLINDILKEKSEEPDYYAQDGLSPMSAFKQGLISKEEYIGFCKGNVIKYTVRCGKKDDAISDIDKAINYLTALKEAYF